MIYVIAIQPRSDADSDLPRHVGDWLAAHLDSWTHPLSGLWIVEGALVADQIFTGLRPLLDAGDRMVIVKGGLEAMSHGVSAEAEAWLAANFPGSLSERIAGET
jgi:hypothetical protein